MRHVRRFAADCLVEASGVEDVEHVPGIPGLESLSLGIFSLRSFEVLRSVPCRTFDPQSGSGNEGYGD